MLLFCVCRSARVLWTLLGGNTMRMLARIHTASLVALLLPAACHNPDEAGVASDTQRIDGDTTKTNANANESQASATIKAVSIASPEVLSLRQSTALVAYTEIPPVMLPGSYRGFLLTSGWTVGCASPHSPMDAPLNFDYCYLASRSKKFNGYGGVAPGDMTQGTDWRQNYDGIYGAHVIVDAAKNYRWVAAIHHNELKNEWDSRYGAYANGYMNIDPKACASGDVNGVYQDCWKAYMAFVTSSWAPYDASSQWGLSNYQEDRGPILWPTAGYTDNAGNIAAPGPRHPSSLYWDHALWVFYLDQSPGSYGIKVAKSTGGGLPHTFNVLKDGAFTEPALPAGFTKENTRAFLGVKGPQALPLFGNEPGREYNRFSVARVKNQNLFVGVEESRVGESWGVSLRVSSDLVHWSERYDLGSLSGDWGSARFHYPAFVNSAFTDNYEVELSDFILLGTSANGTLNAVRLKLTL
jgi:hypothetical protein